MNSIELLVKQLNTGNDWLKMILGDFSDADLLARPAPGANHVLWQLGHLISGEVMMMNAVKPGAMPELPAGFVERFDKKNAGVDDTKQFGNIVSKQQLLDLKTKVRAATIAIVKSFKPEDLDKPSPEMMRSFCPTLADFLGLHSHHDMMHMGQFQVARRKLGKPVIF
ncbi:MAG TPA: DinB family protein [Tepidisphaeraceae bacterium]|nr:DinB family protein [Tepidisphaeraceae bacterium]